MDEFLELFGEAPEESTDKNTEDTLPAQDTPSQVSPPTTVDEFLELFGEAPEGEPEQVDDLSPQQALEDTFIRLCEARRHATDDDARRSIDNELRKVHASYKEHLEKHTLSFFDDIFSADTVTDRERKLFNYLADYGDARGLRMKGELLIKEKRRGKGNNQDEAKGWLCLQQAAEAKDARATYLIGLRHYSASAGTQRDTQLAYRYFLTPATLDYLPAHDMLALIDWNGYKELGKSPSRAQGFMDEAVALCLHLKESHQNLFNCCWLQSCAATYKGISIDMEQFMKLQEKGIELMEGFYPSYTALRLAQCNDDDEYNIRVRICLISQEMEAFPQTYDISNLAKCNLAYVPVEVVDDSSLFYLGLCSYGKNATTGTYSYKITFNRASLPPAPDYSDSEEEAFRKRYRREMSITNTLAHELAHGYLASRYRHLCHVSRANDSIIYEGHATNAAFKFISHNYFMGDMRNSLPRRFTKEKYANTFCSDEYKDFFHNFDSEYLNADGSVSWHQIDIKERNAGGSISPRLRAHTPYEGKTFFLRPGFDPDFYSVAP